MLYGELVIKTEKQSFTGVLTNSRSEMFLWKSQWKTPEMMSILGKIVDISVY